MRKIGYLASGVVAASLMLAACGGSGSSESTSTTGSTNTPPPGGPTTTSVTPAEGGLTGSTPEGLVEAADALFSAFEPEFGASERVDGQAMSLCEHELAAPAESTAWMRFRRAEGDGTERSLFVDLLATGSPAEASQRLEDLAAGIASCGPHAREDIASDGVWVASRGSMLGHEGIRWSDDLISRGPGGRLHDAFVTTSGRFVVQVWAESRSVFQPTFDSMERPTPLLEESLQIAVDILGER